MPHDSGYVMTAISEDHRHQACGKLLDWGHEPHPWDFSRWGPGWWRYRPGSAESSWMTGQQHRLRHRNHDGGTTQWTRTSHKAKPFKSIMTDTCIDQAINEESNRGPEVEAFSD